jgi:phage tail sheath protein FI
MPEYLSPAVYVEEQEGLQPIEGVSTSTTGFIGVTERGPITGLPVLVTSFTEFRRAFGGYFDFGPTFLGLNNLPHAVNGFFVNGGKRLYIRRVTGAGANAATTTTKGGLVTRLAADTSPADLTHARLATLRNIQNTDSLTFRMAKNGLTTTSAGHAISSYDRATNIVTFAPALPATPVFEAQYTTVEASIARPGSFTITAADPGEWGNGLDIRAYHTSPARAEVVTIVAAPSHDVQLRTTAGFYVGAWVEFDLGPGAPPDKIWRQVTAINGQVITISGAALAAGSLNPNAATATTLASVCEFGLTVSFEDVNEQSRGLTLANSPGKYYSDIIRNRSILITVGLPPAATDPTEFPSGDDGLHIALGGGVNGGVPADADFVGVDLGPGNRSGLQALIDIDQISIIAAPGIATPVVQQALIDQCELLKYRIALLDPRPKASNLAPDMYDIQLQRGLYDSKYAALYYPRIILNDPLSALDIPVPPSGHIAGICARVDEQRGVHKAPANELIRDCTAIELILNKGEQDVLNSEPMNINVLRDFQHEGRGLRVWGARCITSLTLWKYLNVRRLFNFIEASLDRGSQWAIFEPNDERLWARVRQSISMFLTAVWRDGALMGSRPEEAYFVKCDRTTMTQNDIDNGRLIILVGIAPVKPAEFVIIRIGQWAGGSSAEEL